MSQTRYHPSNRFRQLFPRYDDPAYYLLGLAISSDKGLHWTARDEFNRATDFLSPSHVHASVCRSVIEDRDYTFNAITKIRKALQL